MAKKPTIVVVDSETISEIMGKVVRDVLNGKTDKQTALNSFARKVTGGQIWGAIVNSSDPVFASGLSASDLDGGSPSKASAKEPEQSDRISEDIRLMATHEVDWLTCCFVPQAWRHDNATDADPEGETTWNMTLEEARELAEMPGANLDEILDDPYARDKLRNSIHAPEWVKDWSGPFEVEEEDRHLREDHLWDQKAEKVWSRGRESFEFLCENDTAISERIGEFSLTSEAVSAAVDKVSQAWFKEHGIHLVDEIEEEDLQGILNAIVDHHYGPMLTEIEALDPDASDPAPSAK